MRFHITIEVTQSSEEAVRAAARLVGDDVRVLAVRELAIGAPRPSLPHRPGFKVCTLCGGDWDNGRMSCMGCVKGYVEA